MLALASEQQEEEKCRVYVNAWKKINSEKIKRKKKKKRKRKREFLHLRKTPATSVRNHHPILMKVCVHETYVYMTCSHRTFQSILPRLAWWNFRSLPWLPAVGKSFTYAVRTGTVASQRKRCAGSREDKTPLCAGDVEDEVLRCYDCGPKWKLSLGETLV